MASIGPILMHGGPRLLRPSQQYATYVSIVAEPKQWQVHFYLFVLILLFLLKSLIHRQYAYPPYHPMILAPLPFSSSLAMMSFSISLVPS